MRGRAIGLTANYLQHIPAIVSSRSWWIDCCDVRRWSSCFLDHSLKFSCLQALSLLISFRLQLHFGRLRSEEMKFFQAYFSFKFLVIEARAHFTTLPRTSTSTQFGFQEQSSIHEFVPKTLNRRHHIFICVVFFHFVRWGMVGRSESHSARGASTQRLSSILLRTHLTHLCTFVWKLVWRV